MSISERYTIPLVTGENTISAAAFNSTNTVMSAMHTVKVNCTVSRRPARLYVLAVGADRYVDSTRNLRFTVKDATDFAALLQQAGQGIYTDVVLKTLLSEAATKLGIIRTVLEIGGEMAPEDTFVLYAATHGTVVDDRYYILTSEFDEYARESNTVSSVELMELSKRVPALKQVLILDTCQAGGMNPIVAGLYDSRISVLAKASGMHLFAGAKAYQDALDNYQGNGLFTHFLLKGLRGLADASKDGHVTATELGGFLGGTVSEASKGKQVPVVRCFGTDLPLARCSR